MSQIALALREAAGKSSNSSLLDLIARKETVIQKEKEDKKKRILKAKAEESKVKEATPAVKKKQTSKPIRKPAANKKPAK